MLPWPPNALYAVAPKARMYLHPMSRRYSSSACKYGRHRLISPCFGVRLSGGRHLTTLVTCADSRVSPCRASSSHRSCPLGPTNGRPWRSSSAPGASPTTAKVGLSLRSEEHTSFRSSACEYGRHRFVSPCFGVRLSGGRHLTTLVTCADSRVSPCRASSSHRSCPLGPTNGRPWRSSSAPGASPTTAKVGLSL